MTAPQPPSRYAIKSRRVLLPQGVVEAALLVDAGTIVRATQDAAGDAPLIDAGDALIAPGVVDAHVHINEPGRTDWEGFATATAAAAAGGVTTLIDMPLNSSPVTTSHSALAHKRDATRGKLRVDVAFYGGLVAGSADAAAELAGEGVAGIKAFLCDSGLDEFPAAGEDDLRAVGAKLAELGTPLLVHAELPGPSTLPPLTPSRRYADYLASRPPGWESAAIEMVIRVCRDTGCPVHIVHLANSDALPAINAAKQEGLPITVETCPHYLHFAADDVPDGATLMKCAPPIREGRHREALWQAVTAGQIDTIGSDHSPC
ncbi:MAG: allantoinase AllB, partial [Planctomycetota bacterium]